MSTGAPGPAPGPHVIRNVFLAPLPNSDTTFVACHQEERPANDPDELSVTFHCQLPENFSGNVTGAAAKVIDTAGNLFANPLVTVVAPPIVPSSLIVRAGVGTAPYVNIIVLIKRPTTPSPSWPPVIVYALTATCDLRPNPE